MCPKNNTTQSRKGKHLEYIERQAIERWYNRERKSKAEIARLLERNEKTIRNEIKKGLIRNLTSDLIEIWVYSADVGQEKYEYIKTGKGPELKIGNDYELKEYIEKSHIKYFSGEGGKLLVVAYPESSCAYALVIQ